MNKVLVLSNKVPYPTKDGSSIAMARMLEVLLDLTGTSITYGALNTTKHWKHIDDFPSEIMDRISLHVFDVDTSPRISTGLSNLFLTNKPYNVTRFFVYSMRQWLETFDEGHFDVVIIEGAFMGYYVPTAKTIGKKVILRSHNLEHLIWQRTKENTLDPIKKTYYAIQARRLRKFEEKLARICDGIWSISPVDNFWFKALNSNSHFVPVSLKNAEPLEALSPNKCFHLGAMDWKPNKMGVEWFIQKVWPQVLKLNPLAEFHIAGNNMPTNFKTDAEKNIFIHGRVPSAEIFAKSHGIAVIPLLAGSGVRIKLLENGRWSIPMISTRIGAEGIYKDGNNEIVLADFPQDMAQKLVTMMANPIATLEMGKRANVDIMNRFGHLKAVEIVQSIWPL